MGDDRSEQVVEDIARWLVSLGYPIDWSTPTNTPPHYLCLAIEKEWVRQDGTGHNDEGIRSTVAEEGGWGWLR